MHLQINFSWLLPYIMVCALLLELPDLAIGQTTISAVTFKQQMAINGVQLIDVRTEEEFTAGHIGYAQLIDWYKPLSFQQKVNQLNKNKPVLLYCRTGVRSAAAKQWLSSHGFTQVMDLSGGIESWQQRGFPVLK